MLVYAPLAITLLVLVGLSLTRLNGRADRIVNRLSWMAFRGSEIELAGRRERDLRAAGIGTPYRLYAAKTHLYASAAAVCGAVLGIYLGALVIDLLSITRHSPTTASGLFRLLPAWLVAFSAKYFAVLLAASVATGAAGAATVSAIRWQFPAVRANTRRRQIDAGLPATVAFVYALSRGGMAFPDVMRALARNHGVFGTAAEEMSVGVRSVDVFGNDLVTAVRDIGRRTPSEQFQTFAENLTSVLQSGQDLSSFLRDQYERYTKVAEEQQREILDLLATTAEIYVTVVVAGMLFLTTILMVIGLTSGGTLFPLKLITYAVLPATNLLFIAYLSEVTQPLRATKDQFDPELNTEDGPFDVPAHAPRTDGGASSRSRINLGRLNAHRRVRRFVTIVSNPIESLTTQPTLVFYVTVPLAVGFVLAQLPAAMVDGGVRVGVLDDALVRATLFVLATFGVLHELNRRRLERLESALPDLLERLASLNEAGVSVVSSFDRVRQSDMGELDGEVDRIWRDIQWGATVEDALKRFEARVGTPAVTRVVTLTTNAMRASNDIGPVLRIAADQARNDRKLKRHRQQEMFTYLVVIYVAFSVFLVVIGAIDHVLVPSLPTTSGDLSGVATPAFVSLGSIDVEAYRQVFFHATLIQATMSGLVGGQMGNGSIKDGVKHATLMLAVAYVVFLVGRDLFTGGALTAALLASI